MRLLKDALLVRHKDIKPSSSMLVIPDSAEGTKFGIVQATVVAIGSKFRHKNDVHIGDVVTVPFHFGTRMKDGTILYDGEDVSALVT